MNQPNATIPIAKRLSPITRIHRRLSIRPVCKNSAERAYQVPYSTAALVEELSLHEVDQRLARFLASEARLRGQREQEGVTVSLILTNQQIAARIGSVREVVSRALARLSQNGLITVDGRRVSIPDEERLKAYAGE